MIYNMQLKTKSPLFIGGNQQEYRQNDFVFYKGYIYKINENKLMEALLEKKLHDKFSILVSKNPRYFALDRFLKDNSLHNEKFIKRISDFKSKSEINKGYNSFKPFIRNAMGYPYIPGSSIKGALRTAIAYYMLKKIQGLSKDYFRKFFLDDLERSLQSKKSQNDKIIFKLLQNYNFKGRSKEQIDNSNKDILRAIKVSDSEPIEKILNVQEVTVLNIRNEKFQEKANIRMELLPAGTIVNFRLTIDEVIINDFVEDVPINDIEQIIDICKMFSGDLVKEEKSYYNYKKDNNGVIDELKKQNKKVSLAQLQKMRNSNSKNQGVNIDSLLSYYQDDRSLNFRLGAGSSILGNTLIMLLDNDLKLQLRNKFYRYRNIDVFPKTRRVVKENDEYKYPLGWAEMKVKS
ncbi:MAG: type III-A CRISPR-associated RAMP protein Csm5 [bacterium]